MRTYNAKPRSGTDAPQRSNASLLTRRHASPSRDGAPLPARQPDKVPARVHDVLRSSGKALDNGLQQSMERSFAAEFTRTPLHAPADHGVPQRLSVGARSDRHEQEADRVAGNVALARPANSASASRAGVDFSGVQIHTGPKAAESARALGAQAYTMGRHIVFGRDAYRPETSAGRQMLAHELAHVVQQTQAGTASGTSVQRTGFIENVKRFFGGGTFTDDELKTYMNGLRARDYKIEDEFDSDNKARAIAAKDELIQSEGVDMRAALIQEMLSGYTGGDDRKGILTILQKTELEDRRRVVNKVGKDKLVDKFSGEDRDTLYGLLGDLKQHEKDPVGSLWSVAFNLKGAEELRGRMGMAIDRMDATTDGGETINIASNTGNAQQDGTPERVGMVAYPRGQGGMLHLAFHPASVNAEGGLSSAGAASTVAQAKYDPITADKRRATATANVEFSRQKAGEKAQTTGEEQTHATAHQTSSKQSDSNAQTTSKKTTTGKTQGKANESSESHDHQDIKDKTVTETTSSSVTLTLGGKLTAELSGKLGAKLNGGATVDGKMLKALLLLAAPEGGLLLEAIALFLDDIKFSVEGSVEVGFKLSLELSAQLATQWQKAHSEAVREGTIDSHKEEVRRRNDSSNSKSQEKGSSGTKTTGSESGVSDTTTDSVTKKTGSSTTSYDMVPVIDKTSLDVTVN